MSNQVDRSAHAGPAETGDTAGDGLASSSPAPRALFAPEKAAEPRRGLLLALVAGVLVVLVAGLLVAHSRNAGGPAGANAVLRADPYAGNLVMTQVVMSQSTSLSGGTSTFIDGQVRNAGTATVTGISVQVLFHNDEGLAPSAEVLPLSLIRTHQPYIDTEPVSAAPLKPGDEVEFRLVFETIPENWNQQTPEIHFVKILTR